MRRSCRDRLVTLLSGYEQGRYKVVPADQARQGVFYEQVSRQGAGHYPRHALVEGEQKGDQLPPEKPLAYHPSSGAREAINLLAASLAQKTGSTPSPQRKKVWGASKPMGPRLTMR